MNRTSPRTRRANRFGLLILGMGVAVPAVVQNAAVLYHRPERFPVMPFDGDSKLVARWLVPFTLPALAFRSCIRKRYVHSKLNRWARLSAASVMMLATLSVAAWNNWVWSVFIHEGRGHPLNAGLADLGWITATQVGVAGYLVGFVGAAFILYRCTDDVNPRCLNCGYSLVGAVSTACPECGVKTNALTAQAVGADKPP